MTNQSPRSYRPFIQASDPHDHNQHAVLSSADIQPEPHIALSAVSVGSVLSAVRDTRPLVHCITNYVTIHDVANILLALGSSPMMSDDKIDAPALTELASALEINIGTLNPCVIEAMKLSGAVAARRNIPVVLDPVAAGATELRTQAAQEIASAVKLAAIRGNASEIRALAGESHVTRGVDAAQEDAITPDNCITFARCATKVAAQFDTVVVMTGACDIVCDKTRAFVVYNGTPWQGRITGAGCMLSATVAACISAYPHDPLCAALAATTLMGVSGQRAYDKLSQLDLLGNATFSQRMIDEHGLIDALLLEQEARYEQLW